MIDKFTSEPATAEAIPPSEAACSIPNAAGDEGRHASVADGSTFAPGLELLPPGVKEDVEVLYGVLRTLDDLVDEDDPRAAARVEAVDRWARGGQASQTAETRALAELDARHRLPRAHLLEFCAAMRHDIARASIETDAEFMRYCQQAGGGVGIVLVSLLGVAREGDAARREAERLMATLGRAMQVTNIARDIDEDLAHDRIYVPRTMTARFSFPAPGARRELMMELIVRADALYDEGLAAIPLLAKGREAMALSATLYREILRELEREVHPASASIPASASTF